MIPKTRNLSLNKVALLLDEARVAELRRDADKLKNILSNFSDEWDAAHLLVEYPAEKVAELLRLYGFYLTFYGRAKNLKDYNARAKNVLTHAHKLFTEQNNAAKAAETNVLLAFCYWNAGEVENCEAFLSLSEMDFHESVSHPVALQIKINQLMLLCWMQRYQESFAVYEEISPLINSCHDIRIKILYHSESAILLQRRKNYHNSIFHFNESIRLCREDENFHFLALNYNNLSLLYLDWGMTREAHHFSDQSLELLIEMQQSGWIPHILDSKAMIYLREKKYAKALTMVEEALEYFRLGEDFKGLTASLWTRVQCLLRLGRTEEAAFAYGELQQTASEMLGAVAAKMYAAEFAKEIYPLQGKSLSGEVLGLERLLISRALMQTNGAKGKAAEILKLKNHQALSVAMARHPGIYEDLGFRRRAPRNSRKQSAQTTATATDPKRVSFWDAAILPVDPEGSAISFGFTYDGQYKEAYYFNETVMKNFGVADDAIVAVRNIEKLKSGMLVLVRQEASVSLSQVQYDDLYKVVFLIDENGEPSPLHEEQLIGEPFAFCRFDDIGRSEIKFQKLGD